MMEWKRFNGAFNRKREAFADVVWENLSDDEKYALLAEAYGFEFVDIANVDITNEMLELLPSDVIIRCCLLPLGVEDGVLKIAMSDPSDTDTIDHIRFVTKLEVDVVICHSEKLSCSIASCMKDHGDGPL